LPSWLNQHLNEAKKCGIGVTTLWRWLQGEDFERRYREARRRVFEGAQLRLQQIAEEAVDPLQRNLRSKNPSVEVRAFAWEFGSGRQGSRAV